MTRGTSTHSPRRRTPLHRLITAALAVAASAALGVTTSAAPASAAVGPPVNRNIALYNAAAATGGAWILDGDVHSAWRNGGVVQLWTPNNQPQQAWFTVQWPNGTYGFQNNHSRRCLDADVNRIGSNGAVVQVWDCNGLPQQQWTFTPSSVGIGYYTIRSGHAPYLCLDADAHQAGRNGARVQLWSCNGQAQQRWTFTVFN